MISDVSANNWLLPIQGEQYDKDDRAFVRNLALVARIGMESAPVYYSMQRSFWLDYFADMSHRQLQHQCKKLGLPHSGPKGSLVARLVTHHKALTAVRS